MGLAVIKLPQTLENEEYGGSSHARRVNMLAFQSYKMQLKTLAQNASNELEYIAIPD